MNERIIELALEAGLLNYVDNETPRHYFIHAHADLEEVQRFADLIAQECAQICHDMPTIYKVDPSDCAAAIKEHFGIEL